MGDGAAESPLESCSRWPRFLSDFVNLMSSDAYTDDVYTDVHGSTILRSVNLTVNLMYTMQNRAVSAVGEEGEGGALSGLGSSCPNRFLNVSDIPA